MPLARENILRIEPYTPGKPIEQVRRELGIEGEIIKLASNENPIGPSTKAINAIKKKLVEVNYYPEGGCPILKDALAKKHSSVSLTIKPSNIIVGNGSNEILELIAEAFINSNDEVIISNMSFVVYRMVATLMNANIVSVDLKDFTYNLNAIAEKITEKTKLIFICNPNNPTGTMVTSSEVENFLSRVSDNTVVVFDEAYYEYVIRTDFPDILKYIGSNKKIFVLRTFSKIYGLAGLRIGYGISNPELIEVVERVRQPFNVNSIAQEGALSALKDEKHVAESVKVNNEGKLFLTREFSSMNIKYIDTSANFIFIDLEKNNKPIVEGLLKKGIIIRDIGDKFIRVTIGTQQQNEKFISAFREVYK